MKRPIPVYLEVTPKRTFAAGVEWPGWCRSGRTEEEALDALVAYGPRYAKVVGRSAGFSAPTELSMLKVAERLKGGSTTEFGAPQASPRSDRQPLDAAELKRQTTLLRAAWRAFDAMLKHHAGGRAPGRDRGGGGRDQAKMAAHVGDAKRGYLTQLGARPPKDADQRAVRKRVVAALAARAHDEPVDDPSGTKKRWEPRFFVRRCGVARARPRVGDRGPGAALGAEGPRRWEIGRQVRADHLEELLRLGQTLELMDPQREEADAHRQGCSTASRAARESTIWRPCAANEMRAAAWTGSPTYPVSVSVGWPLWRPTLTRTSSPAGQARSRSRRWIARLASRAAGASSKTAKSSSPRASISRPPAARIAARSTRRTSVSRAP